MRLLYKDQFKKIKYNLFYFISLSLLIFIISLTYTSVKTSVRRLNENYDSYLLEQNVQDFYFAMGTVDVNYLGGNAIFELCTELDLQFECGISLSNPNDAISMNNLNILLNERIDQRPDLYEQIIDGYVDEFINRFGYEVEKQRVVNIVVNDYYYKFLTITNNIDIPYMVEGELPTGNYEIAIFPEFAKINGLSIGDNYAIDGTSYLITGFFYAPEFIFPIFSMNSILFDEELQTLVLCNDFTISQLGQFAFTKYLVTGDLSLLFDNVGFDNIITSDLSIMGKNMQMVSVLMPREINFRIISLPTEVNNASAFIDIFLSLFVFFVSMLLLIFMKRYIDKNKKDINTLHSLGYSNFEITKSLLVLPILVSLMSIVGYIVGLLVSSNLFNIYGKRYLFPKADFIIYSDIFIYSVLIPIIFLLITNLVFIYQNVKPRKTKKQHKKLHLFRYTPIKTIITTSILFLSISVMIIFGLSSNSMFTAFVNKTIVGNNYLEMTNLQYITNTDFDDNYESFTRVNASIIKINNSILSTSINTSAYGIDTNNSLKLLINNDFQNNKLLSEGIIISDYLSSSAKLNIGDSITFLIGGQEIEQEILGISNELIETNIFMNKTLLNSLYGLDNSYYNGLYITDNLYESAYIVSSVDYQQSVREFSSLLNISNLIMTFLVSLSIILSLYIFSLILISYFNDNRVNIAILKSIGFNNNEINKKYLLSIYVVLIITFVISIPITKILLDYLLLVLMKNIGFKLVLEISVINTVIGFVSLNIIFILTILSINNHYNNISISEIIKHNIK